MGQEYYFFLSIFIHRRIATIMGIPIKLVLSKVVRFQGEHTRNFSFNNSFNLIESCFWFWWCCLFARWTWELNDPHVHLLQRVTVYCLLSMSSGGSINACVAVCGAPVCAVCGWCTTTYGWHDGGVHVSKLLCRFEWWANGRARLTTELSRLDDDMAWCAPATGGFCLYLYLKMGSRMEERAIWTLLLARAKWNNNRFWVFIENSWLIYFNGWLW